jgi:hypothetical protein
LSINFKTINWKSSLVFSIYRKNFGFRSDTHLGQSVLDKLLPLNSRKTSSVATDDVFSLITKRVTNENGLYWNDELISIFDIEKIKDFGELEYKIQYVLSLILSPEKLFIHAGAVSYRGQGIIFPAISFGGKSTLTKVFIEQGARYFSDDCVVIGKSGRLYPYISKLKIRNGENVQQYLETADLGAKTAKQSVPVKYILFTQYQNKGIWDPLHMEPGRAVMSLLENIFYKPSVRLNPAETIGTLKTLVNNSTVYESVRGEALPLVRDIFKRIDDSLK